MMRTIARTLMLAMLLASALYGHTTRAEGAEGFYLGGNIGASQSTYDSAFINTLFENEAKVAGDTLTINSSALKRSGTAWWADAGYWFGDWLGAEASFVHLGDVSYAAAGTLTPASIGGPVTSSASVTSQGPALSLIARLPLTDALALSVRAGDYYGHTSLESALQFSSTAHSVTQSANSSSLMIGAGLGYTIASHWSVRLDYLRIIHSGSTSVGQFDAGLASAGASYTF